MRCYQRVFITSKADASLMFAPPFLFYSSHDLMAYLALYGLLVMLDYQQSVCSYELGYLYLGSFLLIRNLRIYVLRTYDEIKTEFLSPAS